jgi:hypothetical protein
MNEIEILWANYIQARLALQSQGYLRTYRSPTTDFAEWIVSKVLNGNLAPNRVQACYDVVNENGMKIQVKSLAKHITNPAGYTIKQKDRENSIATHFAFVYFDELIPTVFFLIEKDRFHKKFNNIRRVNRTDLEDAVNNSEAVKYLINLGEESYSTPDLP